MSTISHQLSPTDSMVVTTWPVWQRAALPKPSRPLVDPLRLLTHPIGAQGECMPTWQRGADGTMWLECQHLRYVVEEWE